MSKPTPALLFRTPFWVQPPSDPDVELLLKPMSFRQVHTLSEAVYAISPESGLKVYYTSRDAVASSLLQWRGAHGFLNAEQLVKQLSQTDVEYLFEVLQTLSIYGPEGRDKLSSILEIQFDDRFDESWQCHNCQKRKGLQQARNCPMLEANKRHNDFKIVVGEKVYLECPIFDMDTFYLSQASQAYKLYQLSLLPEAGGIGEQTHFFVSAAQQYDARVKKAERDAHEKLKRKSK